MASDIRTDLLDAVPFNSLFEMLISLSLSTTLSLKAPFNSLFEMLVNTGDYVLVADELSILYLRCCGGGGGGGV